MPRLPQITRAAGFSLALTPLANAGVSFSSPVLIDTPGATADILVLDLDDDGDLDIASLEVEFNFAVGEAEGIVNIALNDGAAGFTTVTSIDLGTFGSLEFALQTLVAADLDNDGDPDLAAIGTTAPLLVLFNDGDGGFGPAVDTGISVDFGPLTALLDAGDLDGDGDVDFALGLPGQIATNVGGGFFLASEFSDDTNPRNLEVVDLDGDGDEDIAYGFFVHLNDGTGSFTMQADTYPGAGAPQCVFADFDADGDEDVACARAFANELAVALNNGDATFGPTNAIETPIAPVDVHLGHFDDDGELDLVVTHSGEEVIAVHLGRGDGTFDEAVILPSPGGTVAAAGDLDGDGLDDLVVSTTFIFSVGPIAVLLNEDEPVAIPGDLDEDGVVGVSDLLLMLAAWGPCPAPCPPACTADVDADCNVGVTDLLVLLSNWG